jgi:DEAD/DEAH box helicase domain-containing protein
MDSMKKVRGFIEEKFSSQLKEKLSLEPCTAQFSPLPALVPGLQDILEKLGFQNLYSHQLEAFHSIHAKKDTLLLSRTASGKTLSFLLPILNDYFSSGENFSVLLLYPTKALSRDQESTLGKLLKFSANTKFGTFDGDTPKEERENLVKTANFILSNPDMLHSGILPNHSRKWRSFLKKLKYIVIDEVHTYRGAFGSHVANVMRRLLRVCEMHGSSPIFICSSATIGNPKEHANALFQRDFHVIDRDGSARAKKEIFLINPTMVQKLDGASFRRSTSSISVPLLKYAVREKIRTICFCRARQEVERLYQAVIQDDPYLKDKIKPYRGGLLPSERRALERDLFQGKIQAIITTNALELGIDIGDMSLCILNGHPGSVSSFWQQAGRVGRKGKESLIVFIAKDSPIDQHIINHPEFITDAPSEEAWLSADNPYILLQHLPCAAYEHPLRGLESNYSNRIYSLAMQTLTNSNVLSAYKDVYRYNLQEYPAKGVNLRGMTDYNVLIYHNGNVIGEIDPIGAMGTLYKDAIYQHLGRKYMSVDLDLEKKLCEVKLVDVDYYTEAVWESHVKLIESDEKQIKHNTLYEFGLMHITKQPKLYKKIKEKKYENVGSGPITLPPFEYDTTGFYILPSHEWVTFLNLKNQEYADMALNGLGYLLKNIAPSFCMGDSTDIHTDVAIAESASSVWKNALYLYDAIEGGVGFSEKIFEKISDVLELSEKIIEDCECRYGCPSCVVPTPMSHEKNGETIIKFSNASVETAKSLLASLLRGEFYLPNIVILEELGHFWNPEIEKDLEYEKDLNKLKRAESILRRKRERIY